MISNEAMLIGQNLGSMIIYDYQDKHSTRSNLRSPAAVEWPLAVCARCPCCTSTGDGGNGCIWITGGNRPWSNPKGFSCLQITSILISLWRSTLHFKKYAARCQRTLDDHTFGSVTSATFFLCTIFPSHLRCVAIFWLVYCELQAPTDSQTCEAKHDWSILIYIKSI